MQLAKFSVVVVILLGRICFSKILIKTNKPDGYAELEDAAIKVLSNCYGNKDKTMVLTADIPGTFMKKLSSQQSYSTVLLDNRHPITMVYSDIYTVHKVKILVAMVTCYESTYEMLESFRKSKYGSSIASVLLIGWSPERKYGPCNSNDDVLNVLFKAHELHRPDVSIICRDVNKGIVIYSFNGVTNYAPKPWRLVETRKWSERPSGFSYFIRQYREDEVMCKNIFFDKLKGMNGLPITVTRQCLPGHCHYVSSMNKHIVTRVETEFVYHFLRYVNATAKTIWQRTGGAESLESRFSIKIWPLSVRRSMLLRTFTYPYALGCNFIITKYRGHKVQIEKIYNVLDEYSWGGFIVVYFITLIFFKYFLHQPLTVGILNLWRLTCCLGLPGLPPNVPPRIYLGCLFFFMVTMQGIFSSSLASVMTRDVPVRQVDTIQDLIDFGYTVYAEETDFRTFTDAGFKGRLIKTPTFSDCLSMLLKRDHLVACYTFNHEYVKTWLASWDKRLHVSRDCTETEYLSMELPHIWAFYEILHKYLAIKKAGGFMHSLDTMVELQMLLEKSLEVEIVEPHAMVLNDLGFAFSILGIGWGCALVSFIVEILISIYQKKVRHHPKFSWIRWNVR